MKDQQKHTLIFTSGCSSQTGESSYSGNARFNYVLVAYHSANLYFKKDSFKDVNKSWSTRLRLIREHCSCSSAGCPGSCSGTNDNCYRSLTKNGDAWSGDARFCGAGA